MKKLFCAVLLATLTVTPSFSQNGLQFYLYSEVVQDGYKQCFYQVYNPFVNRWGSSRATVTANQQCPASPPHGIVNWQ